jgi:hypothetical protein
MASKRTSGMAALGATHVLFGGLGALASIGVVLAATVVLVAPQFVDLSTSPLHIGHDDVARKRSIAVGMLLLGVVRAVTSVLLVVAGIRVLDVAPAGRRLSLAAAFVWTFTNVFEAFALSEPLWLFLASTAYPLFTEWIFLRKDWRAAFTPETVESTVPERHAP